ncbi:MAG: ABC-F family ATP-binding cassette domain-containing protein [Bacteroidota bacterium]|jgi:ATP-binding cassette subfamily F protein uup|nr:ABC-F family ATP-binding cassette domain-containing protein [Chitinophagaceae bacterium]
MHFVSVEKIGKAYGIKPLFKGISFHINEGNKIALIARNGSGKSTLLNILAGKETADLGTVWIHKDVKVILFEQDPSFDEHSNVLDNIFSHQHPVLDAIKKYEAAEDSGDADLITKAIVEMDEKNAWDFDAKVKQILSKLNIHQLEQKIKLLSGGQRKRIALAKTLIDIGFEHQHCLLIMDEPTNHLDVEMVEWLENYLDKENVTLLLVTHDRYFLDNVCNEIWELDNEKIYTYKGDYENYIEKKAARIESEISTIDKARNTFRKELEWMRKQPKARTTKSKSRQDAFYEIEKVAKQKIEDKHIELQMKMNRLGGKVVEMKKVYKSFGEKKILNGFDYTFKNGERVGIIGKNGAGKSTFVNILQGIEEADSGKINIGETVVFGYYSQQGLILKQDMRVIEYVKTIAESFPLAKGGSLSAAQFLELFLFTPDQQYSFISHLSGGEKRRLQLLTILFKNPNFLILDEPTNDLDLPTLNVLENFLFEYPGCLMVISHDRYFMDRIVDHLFVFEGEGTIIDFPGNYANYRVEKELNEDKTSDPTIELKQKSTEPEISKKKAGFNEKREFDLLTKELEKLNKEKEQLALQLSAGNLEYQQLQELSSKFKHVSDQIDKKEMRWLELSEMV